MEMNEMYDDFLTAKGAKEVQRAQNTSSLRRRQTWITPCKPIGAARGKNVSPHLYELRRSSTDLSVVYVELLRSSGECVASCSPALRYASACVKTPRSRHCERSEAIQSVGFQWIASGYRPRNDVAVHFSHNLPRNDGNRNFYNH